MESIDSRYFKKYEVPIWNNLNSSSSYRIKNVSILLSFIIIFLLMVDLYNKSRGLWSLNHGYVMLFYSHIIFILTLLFYISMYYLNQAKHQAFFYKYFNLTFSVLTLNITAFISGWVDQLIHGEITVYAMGCFITAILLYLKPKYIILIYMQSYILFLFCLYATQKNSAIRQGDLLNSLIILLLASFISFIMSRLAQREYLYKYKLEELVKERSDALIIQQQAINRLQMFNLIGVMSANIAHEIRNPMTSVRGFLQLLGEKKYYEEDKSIFEIMIQELDRANSIITEFLSLAKEKQCLLKKNNINNIISKLIPLLDTNTQYTIKLDLGKIPELLLDEKEICQIILNFANNGFESMPSGGCLTIKTYQLKNKVIMEVKDEGEGIKPDILPKIGIPFFTTKEKGTGLGLAICTNIIEQHKAQLKIESGSAGSIFRVIFDIPA